MKTTVDISDSVLQQAKKLAVRERTTLGALVEKGLRQVLAEKQRRGSFRLRKASFRGRGLRAEWADAGWALIRDRSYEERGS